MLTFRLLLKILQPTSQALQRPFSTNRPFMKAPELKTYAALCTEFYDLEQHYNGVQALVFYLEKAKNAQVPILEPMCGSGRFLIPLLQAGLDAEGFDASPAMLDAFKKKYAHISTQKPPVWQEFVEEFNNNKKYNLIFIPYGSWGLIIQKEAVLKGLTTLARHLAPKGRCILEIETVSSVPKPCGIWRRGVHTRQNGSHLALNTLTSYQEETQLFKAFCRYESIVSGQIEAIEEEIFEQYLYQENELDTLLLAAGFTHFIKYPAYDQSKPVTSDTPIIVYECFVS